MIDFMVLAGPRSGTTWAANWLTTDTTYCFHDPLIEYTRHRLDNIVIPGKVLGISCTSSFLFPEWVLKHPARKVLLYRSMEEVNRSLDALALPRLKESEHMRRMVEYVDAKIPAWPWHALFNPKLALVIWDELLPNLPFDMHRHHLLTGMNVQPQFNRLPVGAEAMADLVQRSKDVLI